MSAGKGDRPRTTPDDQYRANYDVIFRRCKCGGRFSEGIALRQTYVGSPDFPGDTRAMTIHAGGPGELGPCWKCEACGHSITKP